MENVESEIECPNEIEETKVAQVFTLEGSSICYFISKLELFN